VSSTALVRYRGNDYSVPTRYGFQDVCGEGFRGRGGVLSGAQEIARHVRSYGSGDYVADPLHYLALIETKPNALNQAAALQNWALPAAFAHLRQLLEAIHMGAIGFDAVKQITLARIKRRPVWLDLTTYPHLPRLDVKVSQAADYTALVPQVSKGMAAGAGCPITARSATVEFLFSKTRNLKDGKRFSAGPTSAMACLTKLPSMVVPPTSKPPGTVTAKPGCGPAPASSRSRFARAVT